MAYFLRYGVERHHLECDLERGYSFNSYHFDDTVEGLLREQGYELYDYNRDDDYTEEQIEELAEELNVRQHSTGEYGFALAGLCGYEYETIEEAREAIKTGKYQDSTYTGYPLAGIYEGVRVGVDNDSLAELFRPTALVEVIDMETMEVAA